MTAAPDDECPETRRRMTLEEWSLMDDEVPGELVGGYLVPEETVTFLHAAAITWLVSTLGEWADKRRAIVLASGLKFGIRQLNNGRKADLSMYLPGSRRPSRNCMLVTLPPDVIVEVLACAPEDVHRDRVDKLLDYACFGVRYYWILDPQSRLLEVRELDSSGRYHVVQAASAGTVAAYGCEGLALDLDDLWADLDSLTEEDG